MSKALFMCLFLFPTMALSQAVDDKFACTPADPSWSITEVAKWAEQMDKLGNDFLRKDGDLYTKFGNPVDSSCWKGLSKEEWERRMARIEAGISYAFTQAQRCWSNIGFPEASGIISKVRRTRINCSESKNAAAAQTRTVDDCSPTYNHKYEMVDWGGYMDTAPMEWVGSTIFHEALHWSVANNRTYHNATKTRNRLGCDKSLYEDRVYMMEASCFPLSDVGQEFYKDPNGAINCPGLCEKALTDSDPGMAKKFNLKGGEALKGYNYKPQQAQLTCNKIRNVTKDYAWSRKMLKEVTERRSGFMKFAEEKLGIDEDGKHLKTIIQEAFFLVENAHDPNSSLAGIKKNFKDKQEKLVAGMKSICGKTSKSKELEWFCKEHSPEKNPFTEELVRLKIKLDDIKVSDFALYSKANQLPTVKKN